MTSSACQSVSASRLSIVKLLGQTIDNSSAVFAIKNMLSLKDSLAVLRKTNALLEGHFVLSSGLHSPKYVQCAKLLSYPHLSKKFL